MALGLQFRPIIRYQNVVFGRFLQHPLPAIDCGGRHWNLGLVRFLRGRRGHGGYDHRHIKGILVYFIRFAKNTTEAANSWQGFSFKVLQKKANGPHVWPQ